jgi:spore coat protein U-like protein
MMIFLLFLAQLTHASCNDLKIEQLDDVNLTGNLAPSETFRIKRGNNGGCNFFVTVSNGGAAGFASRRLLHADNSSSLPVQLCRDASCANILKHFPQVSSSADVFTGTFISGNGNPDTVNFVIYPRLTAPEYEKFGTYDDDFTVRVYEGSPTGSYSQEDGESFRVRYDMSKKIDLSLVEAGSAFEASSTSKTLDFGPLATGQQLAFDLVTKYNAGYRVRFSSQNNGSLRHTNSSATLGYSLSLNGNAVSLAGSSSSPVQVASGSGVSPVGGMRLAGRVTIGTVAPTAQSGQYKDTITVTVATTE